MSRNHDWPHSIAEIRERLPALHRLRSKDAIVLLEADRHEIAACALKAGATTIITRNVRDFVAAASQIVHRDAVLTFRSTTSAL